MATTTNYGWTTPDDTALVKDGASAIRSLGTSVDTTTKNLNPSTTLGDIEYRSSTANTNTRLGIGSTGDVLTVAGGVPSWAAPAGAGANWSLLNAGGTSLTGAQTITVSGISGADKIMVVLDQASSASANSRINVRLNTDTGNNYNQYGVEITGAVAYGAGNYISVRAITSRFYIGYMQNTASSTVSGAITLSGCNSSGVKQMSAVGSGNDASSSLQRCYMTQGYYNSSSTISSISVFSELGNLDGGDVFVYTSA